MKYYRAEAVRCPGGALAGIASITSDKDTDTIDRLPGGFKIVSTGQGDMIFCAVCKRPAITLSIDP